MSFCKNIQVLFKTECDFLFVECAKIGEGRLFCNKKLKNGYGAHEKVLEI
jgi:hypothetical protein